MTSIWRTRSGRAQAKEVFGKIIRLLIATDFGRPCRCEGRTVGNQAVMGGRRNDAFATRRGMESGSSFRSVVRIGPASSTRACHAGQSPKQCVLGPRSSEVSPAQCFGDGRHASCPGTASACAVIPGNSPMFMPVAAARSRGSPQSMVSSTRTMAETKLRTRRQLA